MRTWGPMAMGFLGITQRRLGALKNSLIPDALANLAAWMSFAMILGIPILGHNAADPFTRQAMAWLEGRYWLDSVPRGFEAARFGENLFISFPPVPSVIEFLFVPFFGQNTPTNLTLLIATWGAMLLAYRILLKATGNRVFSAGSTLAFFWGSQILYLSLEASVWHQGQLYGLFFAIAAYALVLVWPRPEHFALAGLCLGLATGCRPFHLFSAPFLIYLACRNTAPANLRTLARTFVPALTLPLALLAAYNQLRFGSPFEFGHSYLPWSLQLKDGVFSTAYLSRNLFHAFLKLPFWDASHGILSFSGRGTSIFIVSPFILAGLYHFLSSSIPRTERLLAASTLFISWIPLLLHESNGWFQFGYRYSVDLIPILLVLYGRAFSGFNPALLGLGTWSIAINIYGAIWFHALQKGLAPDL